MTSKRPPMLLAAALLLTGSNVSSCPQQQPDGPMTTVFVVRHAEKTDSSEDPDLSEKGRERARRLAEMLSRTPVAALYATQYKRTQQTLEALAAQTGLEIQQIEADDTQRLVDEILTRRRGEVVVAAGHSNTVPEIVNALAAADYPPLDEADYDNLFIVTIGSAGAVVQQLRFGVDLVRQP